MNTYIVITPITGYDRTDLETHIENRVYKNSEKAFKSIKMHSQIKCDIQIVTLSEFVDMVNNEDFDDTTNWISYIHLTEGM